MQQGWAEIRKFVNQFTLWPELRPDLTGNQRGNVTSSTATTDLDRLAESISAGAEPELRLALSKVAMEVNARVQTGSASSADYMPSVLRTLRALPSTSHADLHTNCLLDISHFYYLSGQTFNAIEPAKDAVNLAAQSSNKSLLRK